MILFILSTLLCFLTGAARDDGALLNGRGFLETETVDASEEEILQVHVVEGGHDLLVVALDQAVRVVHNAYMVASENYMSKRNSQLHRESRFSLPTSHQI